MAIKINGKTLQSQVHRNNGVDSRGVLHMSANKELYEIQRSNNFAFVIPTGGLSAFKKSNSDASIPARTFAEAIRLSVVEASIPHFEQGVIEVKRGNGTLKYAGNPQFNSGTLVLNDFIGLQTIETLMAWQHASYDVDTEKVGIQSDYKIDCQLIEYSPDYQVVRTWTLYGCWISGISEGDLSVDNNDARRVTATIQYDRAKLDLSDE